MPPACPNPHLVTPACCPPPPGPSTSRPSTPTHQRKKSEELERYPALLEFSGAILEGLRNVGLIGSSSQGRSVDLEPARALVRAALNYRWGVRRVGGGWGWG